MPLNHVIAFIPHAYHPSIGGAQAYTRGLAEALSRAAHETHVIAPDVIDPEAFYSLGHTAVGRPSESLNGVSIHRVPILGDKSRGELKARQRRFAKGSRRVLGEIRPDLVITLPHLFPNVPVTIKNRRRSPWQLLYAPLLHEEDLNWSIEAVATALAKTDGAIALTPHEAMRLAAAYGVTPDRIALVSPGVAVTSIDTPAHREPIVAFVGRRSASKRITELMAAMQVVWSTHPNARLVLAGTGAAGEPDPADPWREDQRVRVIDSPSDEQRDRILASASVAASASVTESFGITTLEAWAQGTPVVVVDTPVSQSIVRDGVDGLLTGASPEDIGHGLLKVLGDASLATVMGRAGLERARTEFTWERSAAALIAFADSSTGQGVTRMLRPPAHSKRHPDPS